MWCSVVSANRARGRSLRALPQRAYRFLLTLQNRAAKKVGTCTAKCMILTVVSLTLNFSIWIDVEINFRALCFHQRDGSGALRGFGLASRAPAATVMQFPTKGFIIKENAPEKRTLSYSHEEGKEAKLFSKSKLFVLCLRFSQHFACNFI